MDSNSSSVYYWDSEDTDSVNVRKLDDKQADLLAENFSNSKIISIDYEIQGSMEKTAKAESQKSGDTPKGSNSVASNDVKFLSEDTQLEQSSFRIRAPENIHGIKFDDDEASDSAEGEEEEGEEAEERDCLPEAEGILPLRVKDDLSSSEDEGGDDDHGSMDSHIPIRGFSIREDIIMKRENEGSQDSDITTVKEKSLDGAILYQTERIVDREEPIRTGLRIRSSREDVPFSCDPLLFPGVPSSVMDKEYGESELASPNNKSISPAIILDSQPLEVELPAVEKSVENVPIVQNDQASKDKFVAEPEYDSDKDYISVSCFPRCFKKWNVTRK